MQRALVIYFKRQMIQKKNGQGNKVTYKINCKHSPFVSYLAVDYFVSENLTHK